MSNPHIKNIANDWFVHWMIHNSILNGKLQKPGDLIIFMPDELKDLKSEDIQDPLIKELQELQRDDQRRLPAIDQIMGE